jgi:hypothetical protein
MKSKLAVIATLVYITFAGLLTPGQSTEMSRENLNKARVIGYVAKGKCLIKIERITEEFYDAVTLTYLRDNPELKPAFEWVTTSINGKAAVKAMTMTPHYDINCNLLLSNKEAGAVIMPYLK